MFEIFRRNRQPEPPLLKVDPRDLLFGDAPMSAWPGSASNAQREPWTSFVRPREHASAGNTTAATNALHRILKMPNLESRHYLQAWHFLKQMGQIGPWEGDRPPAPPSGDVRINLLVPSGLHFGQGKFQQLVRDGMGGPIINAATELMQALIATSQNRRY